MNKLFTKIGAAVVGIAMAIGVGVAVGRDGVKEVNAAGTWEKTNLADLTSSDIFVIVGDNGNTYAMSNNNGTSNPPAAVEVSLNDGKTLITSEVEDTIKWNISGNATDGYTFYPNGSSTTWLYCTSTNNGVRVGTNASKTFAVDSGYLKHGGTSRYVGVYNSSDWRCYTTINNNITGQTFSFFKYVASDEKINPTNISAKHGEDVIAKNSTYNYVGNYGGTVTFTAEATYSHDDGCVDGSEIVWSSSNENVATINKGVVTVKVRGTTVITVATHDATQGYEDVSTSFTLDTTAATYASEPNTVAQAIALLDESQPINNMYIKGYISQIDEYSSTHNSITYWISDDGKTTTQFEAYSGKGIGGADFAAITDLTLGDYVVLVGNAKIYSKQGNPDVYEYNYDNYIVERTTAASQINTFANGFLTAMKANDVCGTTSERWNEDNGAAVKGLWSTWANNFAALAKGVKDLFVKNSDDDDVVEAATLYEHCLARYGASQSLSAWDEVPTSSAPVTLSNVTNNNGVTAIVIIAAIVTTLTVAGIFLLKKKEEK